MNEANKDLLCPKCGTKLEVVATHEELLEIEGNNQDIIRLDESDYYCPNTECEIDNPFAYIKCPSCQEKTLCVTNRTSHCQHCGHDIFYQQCIDCDRIILHKTNQCPFGENHLLSSQT